MNDNPSKKPTLLPLAVRQVLWAFSLPFLLNKLVHQPALLTRNRKLAVGIISPLYLEQSFYLFPFTYMAKVSYWEWLVIASVSVCFSVTATTVSVLSVWGVGFPFFFFFPSFNIPGLLREEIYQKSNPQTRLKAQIKTEREIERGGGDQSNFLWRRISLLGLSGGVPVLQLKANFFYWIPSRDIITSKGYYYPEGFRWNHLSVTFEMQEVTIVIWQHGTCQGPSSQTDKLFT